MADGMDFRSPLDARVSRRKMITVTGQAGLGLLLAACAGAAPTATPTRAPVPTATPTPKPVKDTLRVAWNQAATTVDPHVSSGKDYTILLNVYESPILQNLTKGSLDNQLAENVKFDANGDFIMKFREGIKYHGGETFDAQDVKANIERIINPAIGAFFTARYDSKVVKSIEILDPLTVKLVVNGPPKPALYPNADRIYMAPRSWLQANSKEYINTHTNGTGPYKMTRFESGQPVEMEAFDGWWGLKAGRKLGFKKLRFLVNTEDASRLALLQRGNVDLIYGLPPDLVQIAEAAGFQILNINSLAPGGLPLNTVPEKNLADPSQPNPLKDVRVRQAMNYAVDRDTIIKKLLRGFATPMKAWQPSPTMRGYVPPEQLTDFSYNPDKAKQLLKDAGYANGFKTVFMIPQGKYTQGEEIAQAIIDNLKAVGIQVQGDTVSNPIWLERYTAKRDYAVTMDLGLPPQLTAWGLAETLTLRQKFFPDPEIIKAYEASFKNTIEEQDAGMRVLNKLVWETASMVWLWHPHVLWGAGPDITYQAPPVHYGAYFHEAQLKG